ncbi:TetR/AcrR family transcriptional regulator [Mycobacterium crocinum]|uniref:TetR/AcrR family transcriptional regulator n=2 Tax=Mycolicibacterium TaxID=1866885 RepID=A0ABX8VKB5_9MYCO|nr:MULTISPECIES: TetR/AcrR family transcriptional regulator [Mycolicibacterium]APE18534.1 TetR family transcriptional regulator [Mycobacterium sp. WY10]MCV7216744.1 TetR/AcrR family transcriptional regulator [Mycolicibacterium crocinum]QYL15981.1 TetR/AcrR family transcriptional regulator [Mycolicibacterium pallens]ULN40653.1 TetR/AcrR family transcriptional regulator [Mycolicibacterium crocinum]
MARKGWGGSPPADDAEARKRIIDTALRLVETRGAAQTTMSDIADVLGITRRTVYRYFTGTDELFTAAAEAALDGFVTQIDRVVADMDVTSQLVEVVAYIIERLPQQPQLALLLANDRSNIFSRAMLTRDVIARCRAILHHAQIDWDHLGFDDAMIDELIEFLLRIIQSMVIAPPDPPRSAADLRAYLHRWIGPALTGSR